MSYEVIEKNEYGVLVRNKLKNSPKCTFCKYDKKPQSFCDKICNYFSEFYYLHDQQAAKLSYSECTEKPKVISSDIPHIANIDIADSQKELLDLQLENNRLKERVKELENNTTEVRMTKVYTGLGSASFQERAECCNMPSKLFNFCPNCGRKIIRN